MSTEIELKLLLPGADPGTIGEWLARTPALAHARQDMRWLDNRYFDTPQFTLREQRAALRLRRVGPDWVQTFKTAGVSQGGLSQRGEWEAAVPQGELDPTALANTPWAGLDPDGRLFQQLHPCFETRCQRTTWQVQGADGAAVEVALDVGEIQAGERVLPMLELELELLAGPPQALFELAFALAKHTAVLPFDASKAERGYALAQGMVHAPVRARSTRLSARTHPRLAAQQALSEMFDQFTRNLAGLCHSNDPELVHQARVAWRRWRSAARLFRPWLPALPDRTDLQPLLQALGHLRDLDVAHTDTLPAWESAYLAHDATRATQLKKAHTLLQNAAHAQRAALRQRLAQAGTGQALLRITEWLHALGPHATDSSDKIPATWARERLHKLQHRLQRSLKAAEQAQASESLGHAARLLAKRTRYSIEALTGLLPQPKAQRWARQAADIQTRLGADRDLLQAATLLQTLGAAPALVAFLHGVAAGQHPQPG